MKDGICARARAGVQYIEIFLSSLSPKKSNTNHFRTKTA